MGLIARSLLFLANYQACLLAFAFFNCQVVLANEKHQDSTNLQLTSQTAITDKQVDRVSDLPQVSTTITPLLAQEVSLLKITGVKVNPTATGIEIMLESTSGAIPQPIPKNEGNILTADIPNASLNLPEGKEFLAENPAKGITNVSVKQVDANTVRLSITGNNALPTINFAPSPSGLTLNLTVAEVAEEDEIEVVVTGEQQRGYRVPNSSTATKTDTPLRDIPQSIQVIPRQVIEDQQVVRLEEALRNVSGITFGGSGEGAGISPSLRGFANIPILLDGFRQYGVVGLQSTQETANLESIDVLKGPASILYGEIQPGGVINLVSKKPLSTPSYAAEIQAGSRGLFRPRIDLSGPLTDDGSLLYRLNALFSTERSFRDFDTNLQRFFIAPTLAWKAGDRTDLGFKLEYLNSRQPFDTGRVALGNQVIDIPRDRIINEPNDFAENRILNLGLNLEHRFDDNWKIRSSFQYLSRNILQDFAFPFSVDAATGIITRNLGGFDIDVKTYALQTNVVGKFNTGALKHTLLFGVDVSQTIDNTFAAFDFTTPLLLDPFNPVYRTIPRGNFRNDPARFSTFVDYQIRERRLGIYLQDQVDLLDNLKLLAGLRYDTVEQNVLNRPTFFNPESSQTIQTDNALSPRIGLVYQPSKEISLYASYSQSFNPSTNAAFGGNILKPERGEGWEVGIKGELFDGKLLATLAYFDIIKQNVATPDPNNPLFSIAAGEQRSRGLEFDLSGQILPGWNIIASYAYTDAKLTRDNTFPVGNRLEGIPEHSVSLWTTYEIPEGDLQGLGLGFGFNYVSDRKGDLENSFDLGSYFLTNAAIFYRRDNWRVAINFKNIFNVDYSNSPFSNTRIDVGEPFTVIGSFSVKF
jgi:iron complex outermembrane recepter protein